MDTLFQLLGEIIKSLLASGDPTVAIIALLMLIIGYLLFDKKKSDEKNDTLINDLHKTLNERHAEHATVLKEVIDKYHSGQLSVIEAVNEIKIILAKIDGKL